MRSADPAVAVLVITHREGTGGPHDTAMRTAPATIEANKLRNRSAIQRQVSHKSASGSSVNGTASIYVPGGPNPVKGQDLGSIEPAAAG